MALIGSSFGGNKFMDDGSCRCELGKDKVDFARLLFDASHGESDDGFAQLKVAQCLEFGIGTDIDMQSAAGWYGQSLKAGNACAQFVNGVHLFCEKDQCVRGHRIIDNTPGAQLNRRWNVEYQTNRIAELWSGKYRDLSKRKVCAADLFRMSANQGHAEAMFALGLCYEYGTGVPKCAADAVPWVRLGSDAGCLEATYHLAMYYLYGYGIAIDVGDAIRLLRECDSRGFHPAGRKLSTLVGFKL